MAQHTCRAHGIGTYPSGEVAASTQSIIADPDPRPSTALPAKLCATTPAVADRQPVRDGGKGARTSKHDPVTGEIDPLSVGRVQSWGQTLNLAAATFLPEDAKGKAALTPEIHAFGPGASCRGYASGGG